MAHIRLFIASMLLERALSSAFLSGDLTHSPWGCSNKENADINIFLESREQFSPSHVHIHFCYDLDHYHTEVNTFRIINRAINMGPYNEQLVSACPEVESHSIGTKKFVCPQVAVDFIRFGFPRAAAAKVQNYTITTNQDRCACQTERLTTATTLASDPTTATATVTEVTTPEATTSEATTRKVTTPRATTFGVVAMETLAPRAVQEKPIKSNVVMNSSAKLNLVLPIWIVALLIVLPATQSF